MSTPEARRRHSEHLPTRRRVVLAWALAGLVAVTGLVALAEALRLDHPPAGPQTPEVADELDPLRDDVVCDLAVPREGEDREVAAAEPELPSEVTSNQLYDCPGTWDGRRVRYTGEAVGALLERRDRVWMQLNDDAYAAGIGPLPTHRDFRGGNAGIGVHAPPDLAAAVQVVGGPATRGDLVEVVGVFRRVDPATNEVAVLEVERLQVVRDGGPLEVPNHPARAWVALVVAALAAVAVVEERRRRTR